MIKKLVTVFAVAAIFAGTAWGLNAFDTQQTDAPCACCGESCTCVDCICDEMGCACDTGGECFCSDGCCCSKEK